MINDPKCTGKTDIRILQESMNSAALENAKKLLLCPIFDKEGEIVAVLEAQNKRIDGKIRAFDKDDEQYFFFLGSHIATELYGGTKGFSISDRLNIMSSYSTKMYNLQAFQSKQFKPSST